MRVRVAVRWSARCVRVCVCACVRVYMGACVCVCARVRSVSTVGGVCARAGAVVPFCVCVYNDVLLPVRTLCTPSGRRPGRNARRRDASPRARTPGQFRRQTTAAPELFHIIQRVAAAADSRIRRRQPALVLGGAFRVYSRECKHRVPAPCRRVVAVVRREAAVLCAFFRRAK